MCSYRVYEVCSSILNDGPVCDFSSHVVGTLTYFEIANLEITVSQSTAGKHIASKISWNHTDATIHIENR